ncbi:hypothetical protein L227DRAFT_571893 [Lentinus tigrinus ALCF2SS1-6]|uniref:Secreted protein n=1 Tax=Lentinus tigrinus ALCF2SS1-6 TaxID=1328759 RepID=A0A5C2SMJ9_9APHY|nr:hypothetical protein L227DRAFT_571893 [Lentinus tigrinus ALCF2SS1-6]
MFSLSQQLAIVCACTSVAKGCEGAKPKISCSNRDWRTRASWAFECRWKDLSQGQDINERCSLRISRAQGLTKQQPPGTRSSHRGKA